MPRKVFTAGEILTAADVNTNLMDQAVMVFDDSAARGSAIPSPSEGMITYLKDTDSVEKYDGSAFVGVATAPAILQVVSTTKSDTFSAATATFTELTGLSATITPSSVSSTILVMVELTFFGSGGNAMARLMRDSTPIGIGDVDSARQRTTLSGQPAFDGVPSSGANFEDSPATTSAITYSVEVRCSAGSVFVNRTNTGADSTVAARTISTLTLMEVAG